MRAITRNNANLKRGKDLLFLFNGKVYISLKNAKLLCGYSESASNETILSKVSKENVVIQYNFSKKGNLSESYYLNYEGFCQLVKNLKQKDKKQNAILSLEMINEAIKEIRFEHSKSYTKKEDEMINEICATLGKYDEENKHKWIKAYDELDKVLSISIRKEYQKFKIKHSVHLSMISYIKNHTSLTPVLYDIVKNKF